MGRISLPLSLIGRRLYADKHTVADLSVDEYGVWVVFPGEGGAVMVGEVVEEELRLGGTWRVSGVEQGEVGESFVACGVLYFLESGHEKFSSLHFSFDIFTQNKTESSEKLEFINPYAMTTMLQYDPLTDSLLSWDKGRQLTYPLLI